MKQVDIITWEDVMYDDHPNVEQVTYIKGSRQQFRDNHFSAMTRMIALKFGKYATMRGQCGPMLVESKYSGSPTVLVVAVQQNRWSHKDQQNTVTWVVDTVTLGQVLMPYKQFQEVKRAVEADHRKHAALAAAVEKERAAVRAKIIAALGLPPGATIATSDSDWDSKAGKYRKPGWKIGLGKDATKALIQASDDPTAIDALLTELRDIKDPAC